jgi:hypothetical protein
MSVDGTWVIQVKGPTGDQQATAELKSSGTELTGTYSTMGMTLDITEGSIEGDTGRWTAEITKPMSIVSRFQVTFDGDTLTGEVAVGAFGTHPLTGQRQ